MTSLLIFLPLLAGSWLLSAATHDGSGKTHFLAAGRAMGELPLAFSVAASWIWAPALFISSQKAYLDGWVGAFWFIAPNVACLLLFVWFAQRIRLLRPQGFTLSELMRDTYSGRVQSVYWLALGALTVGAFAVQLLAGGKLLARVAGWEYWQGVLALAALPLSYSMAFGLRSSIVTDFVKLAALLAGFALLLPALFSTTGTDAVVRGMAGKGGGVTSLFDARGWEIFVAFGLPATVGLLSGPFGDQSFWQRAYALRDGGSLWRVFGGAALLFVAVPLGMSVIGWSAAGAGFVPHDVQMVNLEFVLATLPGYCGAALVLMIVAGIVSILDSKLCAIAAIAGHDVAQRAGRPGEQDALRFSRLAMVALTATAAGVALLPGLQIVHLFLCYGTLRAATLLPTVYTLAARRPAPEPAVFWGIVAALALGLPAFAAATLTGRTLLALAASVTTVLLPLVTILLWKNKSLVT